MLFHRTNAVPATVPTERAAGLTRLPHAVVVACLLLAVFVVAPPLHVRAVVAQEGTRATENLSVGGGVYSAAQEARGERVYRRSCASCHSSDLQGSEMAPPLQGDEFLDGWEGEPLAELMLFVRTTMPEDDPGALEEDDYLDVLAFMLAANGFPPGEKLTTGMMEHILLEPIR